MASQGTKRVEREWDVSEILIAKTASVHGMITDVSPVKKSKTNESIKYFHGEFSDGIKSVKVVSFDPSLQTILKEALENQVPVSLSNCQVKPNRDNTEVMEILLNKASKISSSPRKFSVNRRIKFPQQCIQLSQIANLANNQIVSVKAKVINMQEPATITTKDSSRCTLQKQDTTIADSTGTNRLVLWENDVSSVQIGKSYCFTDVTVKEYDGFKFLSMGKSAELKAIDDIGEVIEDAEDDIHTGRTIDCGEINTIISCTQFHQCRLCKSKIDLQDSGTIGKCTKCQAVSRINKCPLASVAKVIVTDKRNNDHTITLFEPVLSQLIDGVAGNDLPQKLLMTPAFNFSVSSKGVVFAASIATEN